jgi:hypothetical protein
MPPAREGRLWSEQGPGEKTSRVARTDVGRRVLWAAMTGIYLLFIYVLVFTGAGS